MDVLVWLVIVVGAVYLRFLVAWWPVLDDPDYFTRIEDADRAWERLLHTMARENKMNDEATR